MRAAWFEIYGPPSVLNVAERPDPVADGATAVVEIVAASINPSDVKNVAGQMEGTVLPRIPGRDFAGRVLQGPTDWIGAEVWGTGGDVGFTRDGTHAQRIAVPVAALVRKPAALSFEEASCVGVNFVVAWLGAVEYGAVAAGETVAVIGVGGGVGNAVAQIARHRGARVIGIDRRPPPDDAPAAGVIDGFVTSGPDTVLDLRKLTGGSGANLVFDTVGGVMFETALGCAALQGRVIEISATGKRRVEFDLIEFYHNETRLMGADSRKLGVAESAPLMQSLVAGFEAGAYRPPPIAAVHPLDDVRVAYQAVADGTRGRVVLRP
jgi:NADPH:quinone reductase